MKEDWHDPCPLDPNFCSTTNACALAVERIWSYLTFCNPPFDKAVLFIMKALIQWICYRCNIALILPERSVETKTFKILFQDSDIEIADIYGPFTVAYEGFNQKAGFSTSIVLLLQPEFIELIEQNKRRLHTNFLIGISN